MVLFFSLISFSDFFKKKIDLDFIEIEIDIKQQQQQQQQ